MRRDLITAVLLTFCIALMFVAVPTKSQGALEYDPWKDVNDDGKIDILDVTSLTGVYGAKGTPITKALVAYDSGWINITDKLGQVFNVTHDLNVQDWNNQSIMVEITGRENPTSPIQRLGASTPFTRTYGDLLFERGRCVVQASDGGYAIAGYTNSLGAGDQDFYLVKTDGLGNVQWNKTYGGTGIDQAYSVVQTDDGGYAIVGTTLPVGASNYEAYLVKTDPAGNMQWNRTYGGTSNDIAYSMVRTNDGGYAFAGITMSFGAGLSDMWLVKTDGLGSMQWNRTYGGTSDDDACSVVQTSDSGYAIAGSTVSFGAGINDFYLVKTDPAGNMQWSRTYGGSLSDQARCVVQAGDGGYAMVGYTYSFGVGGYDFYLVKTDPSGNVQWSKTYGGTSYDWAFSMVRTCDGGYAMAGYTSSFGLGDYDMWLVKVDGSGNVQWGRTYGGIDDDEAYSIVQASNGGYAILGTTASFGAGQDDFYLIKTDGLGFEEWSNPSIHVIDWGANTLMLYRDNTLPSWNYVRIRISIVK